ncbi:hypothetical protein NXX36_00090 (plasmid) [Bacteroides fragilis]|nr:hypothetical protein [Bacteroides fragilis]MCS2534461.1 hypothetical protein [Bacteroides fragilis]
MQTIFKFCRMYPPQYTLKGVGGRNLLGNESISPSSPPLSKAHAFRRELFMTNRY